MFMNMILSLMLFAHIGEDVCVFEEQVSRLTEHTDQGSHMSRLALTLN